uniref:HAT C-terminal dimerisation domain-containing protein n=1 Tax=Ciona savignyi TaxID=51511 RepID=H2YLB1_CIOSA
RKSSSQIDSDLVKQYEGEVQYWQELLRRLVSVVKFLCVRGLAFRGNNELIGSSNNGNYLGILELLSEYDTFLAEHISKHANKECCPNAVEFFNLLQNLYSWFVSSTHRWQVHRKHLRGLPVTKALSDTRWSARYDAVRALNKGYHENMSALEELQSDENQPRDSRLVAEGFLKKLQQLEVAILVEVWDTVLERFQKTTVHLLESLLEFVRSQRSEFEYYEDKGIAKSVVKVYKETSKREKTRKRQFDEGCSKETIFSPRERFRCEVYLPIMDALSSAVQHRLHSYMHIQNKFGFLSNICELSKDDIRHAAIQLMETYVNDFEDCFPSEMIHFSEFYKTVSGQEKKKTRNSSTEIEMLLLLNENMCSHIFPNVHIALRIYLCMAPSNCCGERSFSKLKRIKNEARNSMGQERLNFLSLMSIENDVVDSLF